MASTPTREQGTDGNPPTIPPALSEPTKYPSGGFVHESCKSQLGDQFIRSIET